MKWPSTKMTNDANQILILFEYGFRKSGGEEKIGNSRDSERGCGGPAQQPGARWCRAVREGSLLTEKVFL